MKSIPYVVFQICCGCNERLDKKHRRQNIRRVGLVNIEKTRSFFKNDLIQSDDYICNRCRTRVTKNKNRYISTNDSLNSSNNTNTELNSSSDDSNKSLQKVINILEDKQLQLPTAYSSHKQCILCNNSKGLRTVKPESIMYAYLNHGIIIKHHSRCCDNHLDNNGLIKINEFYHIETKLQTYNKDTIMILDSCLAACKKIQNY